MSIVTRCPTTKAPKQLINIYTTIIPWKYKKLIKKMPHKKNQRVVL
jgi:hypothetical protein